MYSQAASSSSETESTSGHGHNIVPQLGPANFFIRRSNARTLITDTTQAEILRYLEDPRTSFRCWTRTPRSRKFSSVQIHHCAAQQLLRESSISLASWITRSDPSVRWTISTSRSLSRKTKFTEMASFSATANANANKHRKQHEFRLDSIYVHLRLKFRKELIHPFLSVCI